MTLTDLSVILIFSFAVAAAGYYWGNYQQSRLRPHVDWQHSFLTGMMSIFHEGEMAFKRGSALLGNPYVQGSPEYRSWAFGWMWSDEQSRWMRKVVLQRSHMSQEQINTRAKALLKEALECELPIGGHECDFLGREDMLLMAIERGMKEASLFSSGTR